MKGIRKIGGAAGIVLAMCSVALAADPPTGLPLKAPAHAAIYDWTGFYLGFHFGYGGGSLGPGTEPLPAQGLIFPHSITGLIGGHQAGYARRFSSRVVLGIEADATFPSTLDGPADGMAFLELDHGPTGLEGQHVAVGLCRHLEEAGA